MEKENRIKKNKQTWNASQSTWSKHHRKYVNTRWWKVQKVSCSALGHRITAMAALTLQKLNTNIIRNAKRAHKNWIVICRLIKNDTSVYKHKHSNSWTLVVSMCAQSSAARDSKFIWYLSGKDVQNMLNVSVVPHIHYRYFARISIRPHMKALCSLRRTVLQPRA